jgi:N-acetylglutamate synthase-like GNAT family acetyltransferase
MIEITSDKAKLDIDFIHDFLEKSYWAKEIPKKIVKKSIENSFCFGIYKNNKQIGFARVVTDFTTFGYLSDVFITPSEQKKGLGTRFINEILDCDELKSLRRWHLITKDAQSFYLDHGFRCVANPEGHMELRIKPDYLR